MRFRVLTRVFLRQGVGCEDCDRHLRVRAQRLAPLLPPLPQGITLTPLLPPLPQGMILLSFRLVYTIDQSHWPPSSPSPPPFHLSHSTHPPSLGSSAMSHTAFPSLNPRLAHSHSINPPLPLITQRFLHASPRLLEPLHLQPLHSESSSSSPHPQHRQPSPSTTPALTLSCRRLLGGVAGRGHCAAAWGRAALR